MMKFIFSLTLLFSIKSFSLVDMNDKQFTQEWFDVAQFITTREYRVSTQGVFGKNWCSILDLKKSPSCSQTLDSKKWKITVKKNKIVKVSSTITKQSFIIKYNSKKLISEIKNTEGQTLASFTYNSQNQLIESSTEWKTTYKYEYNSKGYLTSTIFPDKTYILITYNHNNEVISFKDRDNCTEKYQYAQGSPVNKLVYSSSKAVKNCDGQIVANNTYEFWKTESEIKRIKTTTNGKIRDISYNSKGKPFSISNNNESVLYEYYPDGITIKSKKTKVSLVEFTYNNDKSISVVNSHLIDNKGNPTQSLSTKFYYKNKSISRAENSNGETVEITYNNKKQITTITNKNKQTVYIEYEDIFNKPSVVRIKDQGEILITYKADGSIERVLSPQGAKIASDVSQVFSNFLNVMAPANQELYL